MITTSLTGCAQGLTPQARNVNIPAPQAATERVAGINERPDSVIYLPLGHDVLVPEVRDGEQLPDAMVGPYELRGETLAGALQLIFAGREIPIAFQSDLGLTRTVTVANLKGKLSEVVDQVCSLANLYCVYEDGALVIKERQTFTVTVPPIGTDSERNAVLTSIAGAVKAITGRDPVVDQSSRTIIYEATSRTAQQAARYFQRLRSNTALVVYETYIWEVALNTASSMGINWDQIGSFGKYNTGITVSGTVASGLGTPISIGLPTTGDVDLAAGDVVDFIANYGAVKTISQPQLTMLSGSKARLRVADRQNYVSQITRTLVDNQTTVSTETDSVDTGFTLEIGSNWDNSTVYGNINILLQEVRAIDTFDDNPDAIVQLPQTTEREVQTQVRIRPGDSLLIAGLVREVDSMDKDGLGVDKPILPTSRTAKAGNVELVFLLKPRVIVFTDNNDRYQRQPVDADTPASPVVLNKDAQQSVAATDAVVMAPKAKAKTSKARVFSAETPVPDLPAAAAVPAPETLTTAPEPDAVDKAPLPPVDITPAEDTPVVPTAPAKSTTAVKASPAVAPATATAKVADTPAVAAPVAEAAAAPAAPPPAKTKKVAKAKLAASTSAAAETAATPAPAPSLTPEMTVDIPANANAAQRAEAMEKAALKNAAIAPAAQNATVPVTDQAAVKAETLKEAQAAVAGGTSETAAKTAPKSNYKGPITPSFSSAGPVVSAPDTNGQHRPAASNALGDAVVPAPELPAETRTQNGGAL